MTITVLPDVGERVALDVDMGAQVPCAGFATTDEHPACPLPATWVVVHRCGHTEPICDEHHAEIVAWLSTDGGAVADGCMRWSTQVEWRRL